MIAYTTRLISQERDGTQEAANFTLAASDMLIRDHLVEGLVRACAFQFRFTGANAILRGSTVDELTLTFRTQFGGGTGNNYQNLYMGVLNNLSTGPGETHDLLTTFVSDVWQFISGDNASTPGVGNRVGFTHNHPNGLDQAGAIANGFTAHEPESYIYRAFTGNLATDATVTTRDFAGALQPLVNDPAWDESDQYVTVVLFWESSDWDGGYQWNSNDMHDGITWASGDSGYGPASNDLDHQNTNTQVRTGLSSAVPIPYVTFETSTPSLPFYVGGSESRGRAVMRESLCFGRFHGENVENLTANKSPVLPKQTGGRGDLPITGMNTINPLGDSWAAWVTLGEAFAPTTSRTRLSTTVPADRPPDTVSIFSEDYTSQTAYVDWEADHWQVAYPGPITCASGRFYLEYAPGFGPDWLAGNYFPSFMRARRAGVDIWGLDSNHDESTASQDWLANVFHPDGNTGYDGYRLVPGVFWRWEWQMVCDPEPELRVRCYNHDATTPVFEETITFAPGTDLSFDTLRFGNVATTLRIAHTYLCNVELWTDFYLNGEWLDGPTHQPYVPKAWQWFEWNGPDGSTNELDDLGSVASVNPDGTSVVLDDLPLDYNDTFEYETWNDPQSLSYQKLDALNYGFGTKHLLDLYVPIGEPPEGGWPVIMWLHGGFFVAGGRADAPQLLIDEAIRNRFAFVSLDVVLSAIQSGGAYPAWSANSATARHPTMLLDYKMAANWLRQRGITDDGDGTYPIDGTSIVATGHSAGGLPAWQAAFSESLTDDGNGLDLTLAGNAGIYGYPNEPDPHFVGVYTWAAPADFVGLLDYDPTEGTYQLLSTGHGQVYNTTKFYFGRSTAQAYPDTDDVAAASVGNLVAENAANLVPGVYAGGTADFLVPCATDNPATAPYAQGTHIGDAFAAAASGIPADATFEQHLSAGSLHHLAHFDYDERHFYSWATALVGNRRSAALPAVPSGYTEAWVDEFDDASLLAANWENPRSEHQSGTVSSNQASNAYVQDGLLRIRAQNITTNGRAYGSGYVRKPHNATGQKIPLFSFTEAMVRLPLGHSVWPAFWMCAYSDSDTLEIDAAEMFTSEEPGRLRVVFHSVDHYEANMNRPGGPYEGQFTWHVTNAGGSASKWIGPDIASTRWYRALDYHDPASPDDPPWVKVGVKVSKITGLVGFTVRIELFWNDVPIITWVDPTDPNVSARPPWVLNPGDDTIPGFWDVRFDNWVGGNYIGTAENPPGTRVYTFDTTRQGNTGVTGWGHSPDSEVPSALESRWPFHLDIAWLRTSVPS